MDKVNPYRLTHGELNEEDKLENFEYLELTGDDEDIEILHPETSKNKVGEANEKTVQALNPKDSKEGIANENQKKNQIKSQNKNEIRNRNKSQSRGQTNHCQKKNQYLHQNLITMEIWHNQTLLQ